jgi:hypothetical protein
MAGRRHHHTRHRHHTDAATTRDTAAYPGARHSDRFEITPDIRVLPAYWRGNASAVHRELVARAHTATKSGTPTGRPRLTTVPPVSRRRWACTEMLSGDSLVPWFLDSFT